jgi:hypothetical protein
MAGSGGIVGKKSFGAEKPTTDRISTCTTADAATMAPILRFPRASAPVRVLNPATVEDRLSIVLSLRLCGGGIVLAST